jgi:DNA (cytosine-5)-methyltransferase 1
VTRPTSEIREDTTPYRAAPLKFIDLFCGIGGFRFAFERAGCECVFSSDWNKYAQQTYAANFGEPPHGDIHSVAVAAIPAHDILCAGFPCQPFSIVAATVWNKSYKIDLTYFIYLV